MKVGRGLFIDFEGFQETITDPEILKELNNQLKPAVFKLFKFRDYSRGKELQLGYMRNESIKMFSRASLMLAARERELKRKDMLRELLFTGNNIISINYCFDKISKFLKEETDFSFAKQLFAGAIRPDIIIYREKDNNYKELFADYSFLFYNVNNEKENIIINYIDDIVELYKSTKKNYSSGTENYKNNFYPYNIGEDLFVNWPS